MAGTELRCATSGLNLRPPWITSSNVALRAKFAICFIFAVRQPDPLLHTLQSPGESLKVRSATSMIKILMFLDAVHQHAMSDATGKPKTIVRNDT